MAAVHVRLGPREKFRFHVHYLKATVDNMRREAMGRFYKESIREGSSVVFVVTTVPGSESGEPERPTRLAQDIDAVVRRTFPGSRGSGFFKNPCET